jgi:hypothetical protein
MKLEKKLAIIRILENFGYIFDFYLNNQILL